MPKGKPRKSWIFSKYGERCTKCGRFLNSDDRAYDDNGNSYCLLCDDDSDDEHGGYDDDGIDEELIF